MIAFLLFILLQVADSWTTITALNMGGRELNPVMRYVFGRFGVIKGLVFAKCITVCLFGLFLFDHWIVWGFNVLYTLVVANNIRQFK